MSFTVLGVLFLCGFMSLILLFLAKELTRQYPEKFLLTNQYFIVSTVFYGFLNWVGPMLVIQISAEKGFEGSEYKMGVLFVFLAFPFLLGKLFFLTNLVFELTGFEIPSREKRSLFGIVFVTSLIFLFYLNQYYKSGNFEVLGQMLLYSGIIAVLCTFVLLVLFFFLFHWLPSQEKERQLFMWGVTYFLGFSVYISLSYFTMRHNLEIMSQLLPFLYFSINFVPLLNLKSYVLSKSNRLAHQSSLSSEFQGSRGQGQIEVFAELTSREREIIDFVSKGMSNQEIANELFISPHTVRNHVYSIFKKLKVKNRVELTNLAPDFHRETGKK